MSTKTQEALRTERALKLALEALEECRRDPRLKYEHPYYDKTITAIREALASKNEALMSVPDGAEQPVQQGCMRCNTPKKCALYGCSPLTWPAEQPAQQEPFAYAYTGIKHNGEHHGPHLVWKPAYMDAMSASMGAVAVPLYTSPPIEATPLASQRSVNPWVGLTDEAVWSLYKNLWMFHPAEEPRLAGDILKFARAIEAKLKEKNA